MTVDMFASRFLQELRKQPEFVNSDLRDPRVWPRKNSKDSEFPAWRALFSALCLYGHSTGYKLFSFESFFAQCRKAYTKDHPQRERFEPYFSGDLRKGMRQRVRVWYESGMAETYLYACLVEAIEDKAQAGMVLYDARADWKLKADMTVLIGGTAMRVSAFVGESEFRPLTEARRDSIERYRKQNTSESAHWENQAYKDLPTLQISCHDEDCLRVNGVRLFSARAVNMLLEQLYDAAGFEAARYYYDASGNCVLRRRVKRPDMTL